MHWVAVVLVIGAVASQLADGGYIFTAPKILRSETDALFRLTLTDVKEDGKVTVRLLKYNNDNVVLAEKEYDIKNGESVILPFRVPEHLDSRAKIKVNGTFGSYVFGDSKRISFKKSKNTILVQSDKALYKPGQKVRFRVLPINNELKPVTDVKAPEEPKASIAVLDDEFHEGYNLGAEDARSNISNEGNTEGRAADDTGREQGFPPRNSNSATLPETTTTFAQVPAPLVSGAPFASVLEDLMAHTTVLTDPPEPLPEHSLTKCAPHHFTLSEKFLWDKRENVALWIIPEPIEIPSSFPKKPALEPPAKAPVPSSPMTDYNINLKTQQLAMPPPSSTALGHKEALAPVAQGEPRIHGPLQSTNACNSKAYAGPLHKVDLSSDANKTGPDQSQPYVQTPQLLDERADAHDFLNDVSLEVPIPVELTVIDDLSGQNKSPAGIIAFQRDSSNARGTSRPASSTTSKSTTATILQDHELRRGSPQEIPHSVTQKPRFTPRCSSTNRGERN
ncbi:hypothetical protein HPB52_005613 [Rhipicephalus sanguineus]|uniref:Uncharacterized protein n=1 Tax=Rhipicephalus sanguineus TaxID=34632 RepID=A0A9D4Q152_RHISA|nr:hypothetical protein HPB52_005613 [Rhipicephalus sanguineus]